MGDGLPKWHFDRQKRKKLFTDLKKDFEAKRRSDHEGLYTDVENARARKEILDRFNRRNSSHIFKNILILIGITAIILLLFFFYLRVSI